MSDIDEIRAELSGNTNFDEDHEEELFRRIAEVERQERAGDMVPGLAKSDYILIIALFAILGILPVIYYAIMYF